MMQLDDVVSSVNADQDRFLEATHRSIRWLDRCIKAHKRPSEQNLFAIIARVGLIYPREACENSA